MITYTLDELEQMQRDSLTRLIATAGNPSHLARMVGLPVSTVHGWLRRGRVSREGAKLVEECPNLPFTAQTLRPDL